MIHPSMMQAQEHCQRGQEVAQRIMDMQVENLDCPGVVLLVIVKLICRPMTVNPAEHDMLREWAESVTTAFDLSPQDDDFFRGLFGLSRPMHRPASRQ